MALSKKPPAVFPEGQGERSMKEKIGPEKKDVVLHRIYDAVIGVAAVVNAVLIIIDAAQELNSWEHIGYLVCYFLFFADYAVRFAKAPDKREFFRHNIMDLVAILPIHGILFVTNGRMDVLLRVLNLVRVIAIMFRPLRKLRFFYDTNGFKYVALATLMTIIAGGVLIHYAEDMTFADGMWWAFVTATTVGYGDISPETVYGRLVAAVLMLVGIGLIGSLTSTLTSFFLERRRRTDPRAAVINTVKQQLDRFDELSEQEVDDLCRVLRSMKH